jgi:hypothetical protein
MPINLVRSYTAISIKVVHEQSGKVAYERERLLGIANKLMNFQSGSQQPFALVCDFSALLVDNLLKLFYVTVQLSQYTEVVRLVRFISSVQCML